MAEEKKVTKTKAVKAPSEKKVVTKAEPKKVTDEKVAAKPKKATKSTTNLTIDVFGLDGKVSGSVSLPEELFGEKVNRALVSQAVRVYMANQRQGNASTKTRGEVDGSTRKIYRQKGTGRARHGSVRAPIFVKGGIVFGPKPRDFGLSMPAKMKRKALFSALSGKLQDGGVTVVDGFSKMEPKTKQFVIVLQKLALDDKKKNLLLVTAKESENVKRAVKNVPGVSYIAANRVNTYLIVKSKRVLFMQDAIEQMQKTFLPKE
jgi:large subunit ribosomal protein L4